MCKNPSADIASYMNDLFDVGQVSLTRRRRVVKSFNQLVEGARLLASSKKEDDCAVTDYKSRSPKEELYRSHLESRGLSHFHDPAMGRSNG